MQKEIGGYFELELDTRCEYYQNAISLNNARMCLYYILKNRNYRKIYIPYYICDSILEPITKLGVAIEFYRIDETFLPHFDGKIKSDECMLYVNYFGVCDTNVSLVIERYRNVIIDNTQAFFSRPQDGVDTFYSARKFFGVADGGYLISNIVPPDTLESDVSFERYRYVLGRIDTNASEHYLDFLKNEDSMSNIEPKYMSKLTKRILASIDYTRVQTVRNRNFNFLHEHLKETNEILCKLEQVNGPMVYPYMTSKTGMRQRLIENKIFVATYWKEVSGRIQTNWYEAKLVNNLLPLPIDQRYDIRDMQRIVQLILN
ncbi:hypothetical protein ACFFK0_01935 [Paenibacillus chartarius]|uniref:DegT/DnrJ/EryC1/StrS aminotransferase family protein n=1 Tax=Paenibacillus chartarius TaxID=747481 RepID=A0ABV6DF16_9BACL